MPTETRSSGTRPIETRIVAPGPEDRAVRTEAGLVLQVPEGWELLLPGDATLTRRVKTDGPTWTVQEKKGRRTFSRGVWAPAERIAEIKSALEAERSTDAYAKRRQAEAKRRDRKQATYVDDFREAILSFLNFAPCHGDLAAGLAEAVAQHATPIGSGTVARTQRIPIERRAESAVIAWLRHQTTAYDGMKIARVKGKRREVRRKLAEQSRIMLAGYRDGDVVDPQRCLLRQALNINK